LKHTLKRPEDSSYADASNYMHSSHTHPQQMMLENRTRGLNGGVTQGGSIDSGQNEY
jgi:hypothetical protein